MFIVKLKNSFIEIFYDSKKIFIVLFKVIVPIVIIIRAFELLGLIPVFAKYLEPLTSFVGIDGSLGLVWMAAMLVNICLLYTSPSPRDAHESRMPSSA